MATKVFVDETITTFVQRACVLERGAQLLDLLVFELQLLGPRSDRSAGRQHGDEFDERSAGPGQPDLDHLFRTDGEKSSGTGGQQPGRDEGRGHAPAKSINMHTTPSGWSRSAFIPVSW